MKSKKIELKLLLLVSFIIFFSGGLIYSFFNSPKTLNNISRLDELNYKLKDSTYKDWEIIWGDNTLKEAGEALAIDSLGNVYITGNSLDLNMDVLLVSFDRDGNYRWNTTWGNLGVDWGSAIAIDSSDNIFVAGQHYNTTDNNAIILKFNSLGEYQWNMTWGEIGLDAAYGMVIDSEDNIYITGYTHSRTISGNSDIFLAKYNSTGLEWETVLPGTINNDYGRDLALDSLDNIYLVGNNASVSASDGDVVIAKYNSDGDQLWNATWNKWQDQQGYDIEIDSKNNVYVTGYNRTLTNYDILLLKVNSSNGDIVLDSSWDAGLNKIDIGWELDIDSEDFIYITGESQMSSNFYNVTLLKFDSTLDLKWYINWGGSYHDLGRGIVIDDTKDNIYITGIENSTTLSGDDIFLLRFIEYPPDDFILDSTAGTPEADGIFTLSWTPSDKANNYSVYEFSSYINSINGSLTSLANKTTNLSLPLTGYSDGAYFFIVVAHNVVGDTLSNCIEVIVEISSEPEGGDKIIPGYNICAILIFFILISGVLVKTMRRTYKY